LTKFLLMGLPSMMLLQRILLEQKALHAIFLPWR